MKTATLLAILGTVLCATQASAQQTLLIRAGTLIDCTLHEPSFSSKTAQLGEPLICYAAPLREFGVSVFPRGSYFVGRLADYKNPGRIHGKGWMHLDFDRLILLSFAKTP